MMQKREKNKREDFVDFKRKKEKLVSPKS